MLLRKSAILLSATKWLWICRRPKKRNVGNETKQKMVCVNKVDSTLHVILRGLPPSQERQGGFVARATRPRSLLAQTANNVTCTHTSHPGPFHLLCGWCTDPGLTKGLPQEDFAPVPTRVAGAFLNTLRGSRSPRRERGEVSHPRE